MKVDHRDQLSADAIAAHDAQKDFSDDLWLGVLDEMTSYLRRGGLVLDVGVGSGVVAGRVAERGFEVVGVDFNESMLAETRRRTNRVACAFADARELPVASGCVDAVVVTNVLHLVEDWYRVVDEVTRVLTTDGLLFVTLGGGKRSEIADRVNSYFRRLLPSDAPRAFGPASEAEFADTVKARGLRALPAIVGSEVRSRTIRSMIDRLELNVFTWPAGTKYDALADAARQTRAWAETTFGSQEHRVDVTVELRLSVFARP